MKKPLYIVGVDGSEWSERAVMRAVNLAKQTSAQVEIVSVIEFGKIQPILMEGNEPYIVDKGNEQDETFKKIVEPLLNKHADCGVELTYQMLWGDPVDVLHECAKAEHANMLFMGRRGRSRFVDLLLGSVANKIAHKAGIPVVLVP
ncbi:universal stress protein [Thalassotalea eurytherma]|uniref:UspA domain-containing protein n=1 Tax=Thalassotalea eurytherma TaxID=1144278 RepID=A0ABQ6H443_9GAMM|nr:universal stress protein [Thalassotalea eurytherma]GLX82709.1 hypothetical protein theurythT_21610 [Thalassotalea eurytherma]